MKHLTHDGLVKLARSLPVRGAWIETALIDHFVRRVRKSLPVRGAWIETGCNCSIKKIWSVAPCEGGVD